MLKPVSKKRTHSMTPAVFGDKAVAMKTKTELEQILEDVPNETD